ncbi:MAG: flocculation-associated PEP-CTERM protein PepA [Acetobacteraceae bacterium]|nr:flocculation-associated PEP-CTERM protein PepA [Acetobacteraceae bacterium]
MLHLAISAATRLAGAALLSATMATAAVALPVFTWNPSAAGLTGSTFVGDNLIVSDFTTVVFTPSGGGATFTDEGILAVSGFQLGATPLVGTGLNSTFGLYFGFNATGTQNTPGFGATTVGVFDTLDFTLYGYNVTGPVSYTPLNVTPGGVVAPIALATGSLISGGVGATTIPGVAVVPNANTLVTFTPTAAGAAFFEDPVPFYNAAFSAFTNNPSQVTFTPDGFVITQGGGSVNFLNNPVPEPASMMLFGMALVGLSMVRRRS